VTCTDRNAITTQQMRFKVMTIKALLLTGALSIAAVSVAYATEGPGSPTDGTGPQPRQCSASLA
jgi:hypothetical protein